MLEMNYVLLQTNWPWQRCKFQGKLYLVGPCLEGLCVNILKRSNEFVVLQYYVDYFPLLTQSEFEVAEQ
jgi:hypothetical protein